MSLPLAPTMLPRHLRTSFALSLFFLAGACGPACALAAQEPEPRSTSEAWLGKGTCWLLTDKDGADLPADAVVENFPVLVRLQRASFDFAQCQPHGEDLRFTDAAGKPLPYEIEQWDAAAGTASIWVLVPRIQGGARQPLHLQWGNAHAQSASNAQAVFGAFNGYCSVLHLDSSLVDVLGTVSQKDQGTQPVRGMIGEGRHFDGDSGIFCGDGITAFPAGASNSSTEAWFVAEQPNTTVLAWGQEQRPGKVMLNLLSPPRIAIQCYFADVEASSPLVLRQWTHVVHTYERDNSRVYVNGVLDGASTPRLDIPKAVRFDLGGWHGHGFRGDLDEVRISNVVRSPAWIRLQYENQKPMQTLVGPVVTAGQDSAVSVPALSVEELSVREGESATVTARAGSAQKVYWRLLREGGETTVAADQFEFSLAAGRVTGDQAMALRFVAVYPDQTRTIDIPVTVSEHIPDPEFTLEAPAKWDGRQQLTLAPRVTNLAALQARSAATLQPQWRLEGAAVVKHFENDGLVLERAMASGTFSITLQLGNGGTPVTRTVAIEVQEPPRDAWVQQPFAAEERPEDHQFFARDDEGFGTLVWRGTLPAAADKVFLRVCVGQNRGLVFAECSAPVAADRAYDLRVRLKPGLVTYHAEFGTRTGDRETTLGTALDLVCGDAFLIDGQSNAEATDVGEKDPPLHSEWVRTFGCAGSDPEQARTRVWGPAVVRGRDGGRLQIGYWGSLLGRRLVDSQQMPICILNGAVGGSRIDQHLRNAADPEDVRTIYGRLLWRVREARLSHGIRGILWHQGENDQGADGPTGRFGFEDYRDNFVEMAAGWQRDYPNVQQRYVFQIWPKACSMGFDGSDDRLREVQRRLPKSFARLQVMSTLGIDPPGGCHYPLEGWAQFAQLIGPLMERDFYGVQAKGSIAAPDLRRAHFATTARDQIVLQFDQPVVWDSKLAGQFQLDGKRTEVVSAEVAGNLLTLRFAAATTAASITYLDSRHWQPGNVLRGANGIAALTFCAVPIEGAVR